VVLLLREEVEGVKPAGIIQEIDSSWIGRKIDLLGYGATESALFGQKRIGRTKLVRVGNMLVTFNHAGACSGDSGGPGFDNQTGHIAGVMSAVEIEEMPTPYTYCGRKVSLPRVDYHLDIIQEALDHVGCSSNLECPKNYRCKGEVCVFEEFKGLGESCEEDGECASAFCGEYEGKRFCTRACDWRDVQSCPSGFYCHSSLCEDAFCVPGEKGEKLLGESCSSSVDCESLYCHQGYCSTPCDPAEGECSEGYRCRLLAGSSCGVCFKVKSLGEECDSDQECESEMCVEYKGRRICSLSCDWKEPKGCPSGFYCDSSLCEEAFCVPGERGERLLGESCSRSVDCESLYCHEGYCSTPCDPEGGVCEPGFRCEVIADSVCGFCFKLKPLGKRCVSDKECESNICESVSCLPEVKRCTKACQEGICPSGFVCIEDEDICWLKKGELGALCKKGGDCLCGRCVLVGERRLCSIECNSKEGSCPEGWVCIDNLCIPSREGDRRDGGGGKELKGSFRGGGCACKFISFSQFFDYWLGLFLFLFMVYIFKKVH
jgi:hypothetical protein